MKSLMKNGWKAALVIPALALGLTACSVEQTEEGELPDVDVEGGNMPEYDVDAPDVDVEMEEKTITVPDIDVNEDSDVEPVEPEPEIE